MTASTQLEISEKRKRYLHTMFTTALEGGINYWASTRQYHWSKPNNPDEDSDHLYGDREEDIDGFFAVITPGEGEWGIFDENDDRELRIDLEVMARGARLFWRYCCGYLDSQGREVSEGERTELGEGHYWRQWMVQYLTLGDEGDSDAGVADEIVQWGLFGESVYG